MSRRRKMASKVAVAGVNEHGQDVIVLVDVLVHVHAPVVVIDYPYPSGHGTAIGGAPR